MKFYHLTALALSCLTPMPTHAAELVRVIAETGFNDAEGINANGAADSPYDLSAPLGGQGGAEPLWGPAWTAPHSDRAEVTTNHPWEGDGQLTMLPTTGMWRAWSEPQTGLFVIDQRMRLSANSRVVIYIENSFFNSTNAGQGPMIQLIPDGRVNVVDGTGTGCDTCPGFFTPFHWTPGEWHQVTALIDVESQSYQFFFDGEYFESPHPIGFRGAPSSIDRIRFQPEISGSGIDLDALRVLDFGSAHEGDTDGDGDVDIDDLNHVRNGFGQTGFPVAGDAYPFDGKVDLEDLNRVRNHFGEVNGTTAVPEPGTIALFACGAGFLMLRCRKRHC